MVDYKGQPADKTRTGGWLSTALILVLQACERFTTLGIYLVGTFHLPSATTTNIVSNTTRIVFYLCFFGGFVADSFLRRYWTIVISSLIITLGAGLLSLSCAMPGLRPPPSNINSDTCVQPNGFQVGVLLIALYVIGLGQEELKATVSRFGTDQFDENDKQEKSKMDSFFSRLLFVLSLWGLLGITTTIYVQDNVSYIWGYGFSCFAFFVETLAYLLRTRRNTYKKCAGNPIVQVLNVLVAALRKRKLKCPSNIHALYHDSTKIAPIIRHTNQLCWLDKAAILDENNYGTNSSVTGNRWRLCTVTKVEEVKMMVRLMPIWASIIYCWCIHSLVLTFSVEQASTLERSIGKFLIPAGSFKCRIWFFSSLLVSVVNKVTGTQVGSGWLTSNINYGKLYFVYALLAALSFVNLIFYLLCATWYVKTMKNASRQITSIQVRRRALKILCRRRVV